MRAAPHAPLTVHVERVVLDGLPLGRRDAARFERALAAELAAGLRAAGRLDSGGAALARLRGPDARVARGGAPEDLARGVAGSVAHGLRAEVGR